MSALRGDVRDVHQPVTEWVDRQIARFENALAIAFLTVVTCLVMLQIIFRFVLNRPLSWSGEAATYILVWLTFIGMAIAQRERAHVSMDILPKVTGLADRLVAWLRWGAMAGLFVVLGLGGLQLAIIHSVEHSPALEIPTWVVFSALPVGGLLGVWHLFLAMPVGCREEEGDQRWS